MKMIFTLCCLLIFQTMNAQSKKGFNLKNSLIPVQEIKDGGPPKDGIPSIDNPKFIEARQARLDDNDRILGVFTEGIARAYPIKILNFHEIVNDRFNERPVVITYCPLCGSGIAFDAKLDGKAKTFGVSGLLYNSDVLLYDRETESLWSQLRYQAVSGPLAGRSLEIVNTTNTTWRSWKQRHPNTQVLSENTGYNRNYNVDPYPGYDSSAAIYFEVSQTDTRYHPKETVLGVQIKDKFKAYPFSELEKMKADVLKDKFEGKELEIVYDSENKSAEIFDKDGNPVPAITNFWFAWFAFHPDTAVYTAN